ncbi:hypothetical protein ACWD9K_33560 [Streptomyces sp. 900116325]
MIRIGRETLRCLLARRGVTYSDGCYSVGDATLWGRANRYRNGTANPLAALSHLPRRDRMRR